MTKVTYLWSHVVNNDYIMHREKMHDAFDSLTEGMDNWKMPIATKIKKSDFSLCNEACIYYTGSVLTITKENGDGTVDVKADGYYATIDA